MTSPALIIVPPTPGSNSARAASQPPDTSIDSLTATTQRTSSETTAVTIFSMYGDERESWLSTTETPSRNKDRQSSIRPASSYIPRDSEESSRTSRRDSAPAIAATILADENLVSAPNLIEKSIQKNTPDNRRSTFHESQRESSFEGLPYDRPEPITIRISNDDIPPTPPPKPGSMAAPSPLALQLQSGETNTVIQPLSPGSLLSQSNDALPHLTVLNISPNSPRIILPMGPPQAEGEDEDSYYVRATYASLDVSGVRGDGFEDGEELTRARLGVGKAHLPPSPKPYVPGEELTEKEREVLASLDRYGFSTQTSSDRLVLLDQATLSRALRVAPETASNLPPTPANLPSFPSVPASAEQLKLEGKRIAKWNRMLVPSTHDIGQNISKWTVDSRKNNKFQSRVYKGIPDRWRGATWWMMTDRMAEAGALGEETLGSQYRDFVDMPSTYDVQIDLDVPRTITGHVMFKTRYGQGQRSMFHVLHSFSLFCSKCGYCQGMGPLAATLLCYLEPEKAYACLVRLHDNYAMHDIFSPGFPGLLEAIYVQERIVERMMPGVFAVFKKQMISSTSYATKWYITLFANTVSFQTQLRLWDVFFLEGKDLIILLAVSILWVFRGHILSPSATFESILSILSSFFVVENEDILLTWLRKSMGDRRLRRDMNRWREEWKGLVSRGEDKGVLL